MSSLIGQDNSNTNFELYDLQARRSSVSRRSMPPRPGGFSADRGRGAAFLHPVRPQATRRRVACYHASRRGLTALYYSREIGPSVDPLGLGNRLIFMTGPLTATPLFAVSKFQLATRSPRACSRSRSGSRLLKIELDMFMFQGALIT